MAKFWQKNKQEKSFLVSSFPPNTRILLAQCIKYVNNYVLKYLEKCYIGANKWTFLFTGLSEQVGVYPNHSTTVRLLFSALPITNLRQFQRASTHIQDDCGTILLHSRVFLPVKIKDNLMCNSFYTCNSKKRIKDG